MRPIIRAIARKTADFLLAAAIGVGGTAAWVYWVIYQQP